MLYSGVSVFLETLTWKDVAEYVASGKNLVLIPIGSFEGHGYRERAQKNS